MSDHDFEFEDTWLISEVEGSIGLQAGNSHFELTKNAFGEFVIRNMSLMAWGPAEVMLLDKAREDADFEGWNRFVGLVYVLVSADDSDDDDDDDGDDRDGDDDNGGEVVWRIHQVQCGQDPDDDDLIKVELTPIGGGNVPGGSGRGGRT